MPTPKIPRRRHPLAEGEFGLGLSGDLAFLSTLQCSVRVVVMKEEQGAKICSA